MDITWCVVPTSVQKQTDDFKSVNQDYREWHPWQVIHTPDWSTVAEISLCIAGSYRIRYFGDSKPLIGSISSFTGTSGTFTVA